MEEWQQTETRTNLVFFMIHPGKEQNEISNFGQQVPETLFAPTYVETFVN
jgi:hypothetical protein